MSQHTVFTIQDNLIVNKLPYVEIRITSHTDLHFYTLKKNQSSSIWSVCKDQGSTSLLYCPLNTQKVTWHLSSRYGQRSYVQKLGNIILAN